MHQVVDEKLKTVCCTYPKRVYPKGQILLFADDEPTHIFYILSGKVRMFAITYRGEEVITNIYGEGAFFPLSWVINRTSNTYFYKTEAETTMHLVPPEDAHRLLEENPDIVLSLFGRVYRGVDGLLGRMVQLMSGSARSRLMYELQTEARRFGETLKDGTIKLQLNEQDLADRAGLTRETVSREIQRLKAKKWVTIGKHGGIVVLQIREIEAALQRG